MSDNIRAIVFAATLSVVCCILITAACTGLQKYQIANEILDRQINIVKSVGLVEENKKYTKEEINSLYTEKIVRAWTNSAGKIVLTEPEDEEELLELYFLNENKELAAIIIPLNVRGLWGRIHGYLAINKDGNTVEGFTVASHAETPGLGGEIESRWFRENFSGKKIFDEGNKIVSVSVAKGAAKDRVSEAELPYFVDGISGATLTGNYLATGIKATLTEYETILKKLKSTGKIM